MADRYSKLAWVTGGACVLLTALGLALQVANGASGAAIYPGALIMALLFPIVGALVASRRPRNPIGWILCGMGLSEAISGLAAPYATYALLTAPGSLPGGTFMSWVAFWTWQPGFGLVALLLLFFPTGQLPSRRWRPFAWFTVVATSVGSLADAALAWPLRGHYLAERLDVGIEGGVAYKAFSTIGILLLLVGMLAAIVSLILRFRRSRGDERQQLKWFTYAAALAASDLLASILLNPNGGNLSGGPLDVTLTVLQGVFFAGIPVSIGIAILRYRLYDIDLIINKTLVYAVLTAVLAAVYFGGVASVQYFFRAFAGETSQVAIIASTLTIAALFIPLRRRIQSLIDRRFYRKKYDAAKTLQTFSAKLRDETDLEALSEHLTDVVRETMQPEHVSLWLRSWNGETN